VLKTIIGIMVFNSFTQYNHSLPII